MREWPAGGFNPKTLTMTASVTSGTASLSWNDIGAVAYRVFAGPYPDNLRMVKEVTGLSATLTTSLPQTFFQVTGFMSNESSIGSLILHVP